MQTLYGVYIFLILLLNICDILFLRNEVVLWILEINNNPGLGISSPVIFKLVPRMLDDAFRLTIDKIFETKYSKECIDENGKYKSKYQLDGFTDEENIFEFLCNVK